MLIYVVQVVRDPGCWGTFSTPQRLTQRGTNTEALYTEEWRLTHTELLATNSKTIKSQEHLPASSSRLGRRDYLVRATEDFMLCAFASIHIY